MATLPAVVFALGPAQVLRLVRVAGTLWLVRVSRTVEAGGVLRRRMGLTGTRGAVVAAATTALSVVFAGVILLDPDSPGRRFLADLPENFGTRQVLLSLALAAAATALTLYLRRGGADGEAAALPERSGCSGGEGAGADQSSP
ncbi:hypothetical protein GCM10007079_38520 [Nocardiopsis terrae]|uniref:Uncharacterized protein n=1 Tax=Nocardiopsis terrae TaxID=372655 RepID=A0ABR9HDX5_9ACTN|nr:hypothetical protein [Nocardiopsis terrae]MBE1457238.1 hypothetical protein [Nocardiopsis terrae]GHC91316.1 hypothetical protein GCM10007079_38520 [Nocardiopsis terrae]